MASDQPFSKIVTDENLMETAQHGSRNYPFAFYYEDLSLFDFNCVEWHWHMELEFVYMESGTMTFWIGEKQFVCPRETDYLLTPKSCTAFIHLTAQ